jgi:hypothetical protein
MEAGLRGNVNISFRPGREEWAALERIGWRPTRVSPLTAAGKGSPRRLETVCRRFSNAEELGLKVRAFTN